MNRPIILSFILAVIIMAALMSAAFLFQFVHNRTIQLPRGYCITDVGKAPVLLFGPVNSGGTMIGPCLDGYMVYPRLLIGHVSSQGANNEDSGYFIIDMVTGKTDSYLSKNSWKLLLASYEITGDLKLHKPSAMDEFKGYNKPELPWNEKR